jgi:hypothetical protein
MKLKRITIDFLERMELLDNGFCSGVSLHCHTLFSKEMLDFVPDYAESIPIVSWLWKRETARYRKSEGRSPNFNKGYWEPPLTGRQVFESELSSISRLGLKGMVSITDHDSIQANLDLNGSCQNHTAPISVERTVPFETAYFHIGVHNLPCGSAEAIAKDLLSYTFDPDGPNDATLHRLFSLLDNTPEVLVILNHPVWDIELIGQKGHDRALRTFIREFGKWIHAIEINGFRPWSENQGAIELAEQLSLPIVSGGDRHCLHPNTMLNVTNCENFTDFVGEVRQEKLSKVVVLPDYREPIAFRQVRSMAQILGNYPEFPADRQNWSQRVYFDCEDGKGACPLVEHWNGHGPRWYEWGIGILHILGHPAMLPIFRWATSTATSGTKTAATVHHYRDRLFGT